MPEITCLQVQEIQKLFKAGHSKRKIAKKLRIGRETIQKHTPPVGSVKDRLAWTADEDAILIKHKFCSIAIIQDRLKRAGFNRTFHSINHRRERINHGPLKMAREDADLMNVAEVADVLGVNPATVGDWVRKKLIFGTVLPNTCGNNKRYLFSRADVRKFVKDHPIRLLDKKFDVIWLIDLLANR